jgi:hypothetical protein
MFTEISRAEDPNENAGKLTATLCLAMPPLLSLTNRRHCHEI